MAGLLNKEALRKHSSYSRTDAAHGEGVLGLSGGWQRRGWQRPGWKLPKQHPPPWVGRPPRGGLLDYHRQRGQRVRLDDMLRASEPPACIVKPNQPKTLNRLKPKGAQPAASRCDREHTDFKTAGVKGGSSINPVLNRNMVTPHSSSQLEESC